MGVFKIPRSQTLRFVQVNFDGTNYSYIGLQNFDNRLLMDESWQTPEYKNEYLRKFSKGDPILIQFTTNYNIDKISVQLCNYDGSINLNGLFNRTTIYSYSDGSGNVAYNYLLDQSNVDFYGFFFVKITSEDNTQPQTIFRSESFEINSKYSDLPYVSWQNSDRDGIYWDSSGLTIFGFRAELRIKYSPQLEASIFEGFNFQPETLFSVSKRCWDIKGDPMPRYNCEALKLAFDHYDVFVNNIPVNSNGSSAKINPVDYTNLYNFEITVIETEYEDYSVLQEISGQVISISDVLIDNDNIVLADTDGSILIG